MATMGTPRGQGSCSHIDFSPLWGPKKGKGYVAILMSHNYGDLKRYKLWNEFDVTPL